MNWDHEPGIAEGKELADNYKIETRSCGMSFPCLRIKDCLRRTRAAYPYTAENYICR